MARPHSFSSSSPVEAKPPHRNNSEVLLVTPDLSECLSLGGGGFQAQFWELLFHSSLIMHLSLFIKLVKFDGRKNVQGEYWAYHAYDHMSQDKTETKRQSLFSSKQFLLNFFS